jgi:rubrerythrin
MARALQIPPEDPYVLAVETDRYFCPVCGIGLGQSEFETPEREYSCPFCGTRQTPAILLWND